MSGQGNDKDSRFLMYENFEDIPEVQDNLHKCRILDETHHWLLRVAWVIIVMQFIAVTQGYDNSVWWFIIEQVFIIASLIAAFKARQLIKVRQQMLEEFYAEKLGTTPENLRKFEKEVIHGMYHNNYDAFIDDLKYIRDHPDDDVSANDEDKKKNG